jgi:hypothetical protein
MATMRQPTKQPNMRPATPQASIKRGGGYAGPHVIKDRDDIHKVAAYDPGHKGATKPKLRKWPY